MRWHYQDPEKTHRWFAWYPVVIDGQWVWLEMVERRWSDSFCGGQWRHNIEARHNTVAKGAKNGV